MIRMLILAAVLLVTGCASLNNAGTAEYSVKPIVIDKHTICCEVLVKNGKEYSQLKASIKKSGDDYDVQLEETGVAAFKGQGVAAGATRIGADAIEALGNGLRRQ